METIFAAIVITPFIMLLAILLAIPVFLLNAWVLQTVWLWYAVEFWKQAPMTYHQAIAVLVIVTAAKARYAYKQDSQKDAVRFIVSSFIGPLFFLAFAWLIHFLITK